MGARHDLSFSLVHTQTRQLQSSLLTCLVTSSKVKALDGGGGDSGEYSGLEGGGKGRESHLIIRTFTAPVQTFVQYVISIIVFSSDQPPSASSVRLLILTILHEVQRYRKI